MVAVFHILPSSTDDRARTVVAVTLVSFGSRPWELRPALTATVVVLFGAAWCGCSALPAGKKRVRNTGAAIGLAGSALKYQSRVGEEIIPAGR
ncbi:hypothetical protein [Streptomyces sp. BK205]|uniref:hypothetical protein n=1 Tax=Streptomyces sp. BK205 TaxID=2512164 RepID=UPI0010428CC2|nr:hypothetical protein [Streptomyces sp. BK205]